MDKREVEGKKVGDHQFVADFFFDDALELIRRAILKNGANFALCQMMGFQNMQKDFG